jgi:hypothetical protein
MALLRPFLAACETALFIAMMAAIFMLCLFLDPEVKPSRAAARAHTFTPADSSPVGRLAGVARQTDDAGLFPSNDRPDAIAALLRERP